MRKHLIIHPWSLNSRLATTDALQDRGIGQNSDKPEPASLINCLKSAWQPLTHISDTSCAINSFIDCSTGSSLSHQLYSGQQTNKSQSYTGMSTRPSKYNWHFTPYRKNTGLILCVINIPQWTTAATVIKNNDRLLPMNWMIRTAKE